MKVKKLKDLLNQVSEDAEIYINASTSEHNIYENARELTLEIVQKSSTYNRAKIGDLILTLHM